MHDLICFSHLRWGAAAHRPRHLMRRAARDRRVWFVEEPIVGGAVPRLQRSATPEGVDVCVPHLPDGLPPLATAQAVAALLEQLVMVEGIDAPLAWLYSPRMLPMVDAVGPRTIVYDCVDETVDDGVDDGGTARSPSSELLLDERALFAASSLVFTGSRRVYEARRATHPGVHLFRSSVDVSHFAQARAPGIPEPHALQGLPSPRFCWCGVVDERLDLLLLAEVARRRPMWSWVMIGPTVGIDPRTLPRAANLHWFGPRDYADLPAHLAHVDVGVMPFAQCDATRLHSPTKTAAYFAAGLPVVSTPLPDVVDTLAKRDLVYVAEDAAAFVGACEQALAERADPERRLRIDAWLHEDPWDRTWAEMDRLVQGLAEPPASASQSAR